MAQLPPFVSLILASLVVMGSPGPSTMSVNAVGATQRAVIVYSIALGNAASRQFGRHLTNAEDE